MKIIVYDDSVTAIIDRYGSDARIDDVHVRYLGEELTGSDYKRLEEAHFKRENVRMGEGDPAQESADWYYVTGPRNRCFRILGKLPKEKCFVVTVDESLADEADRLGYRVQHQI